MSVQQVLSGERRWGVAVGDSTDSLRSMPDGCVQCCVTSPPYYGLRSYLPAGHPDKAKEIGLEETPEKYVERMVGVFAEVKRVLRSDGVLWVNIGDSYHGSWGNYGGQNRGNGKQREIVTGSQAPQESYEGLEDWRPPTSRKHIELKPKDRIGIPHMLAFALRADGWYFRDEVIWHKPNPMPSSTTDRTTAAHEFVFMFSKSARYYYDNEAIREGSKVYHRKGTKDGHHLTQQDGYKGLAGGTLKRDPDEPYGFARDITTVGCNKRSVWRISTRPYKGSHYATYPPKLVEPCILAGTSAKGCCPKCGSPWVRVVERKRVATRPGNDTKISAVELKLDRTAGNRNGAGASTLASVVGNRDPQRHVTSTETTGWQPTCKCGEPDTVPCVVLDPFVGSGTTLEVANRHGRRAVGCDLDERNLKLIRGRMELLTPDLAFA